jgi:hypothetical protein
MAPERTAAPVLPTAVTGLVDLGRLIRELDAIENAMQGQHLRTGQAEDGLQLPKLSALLDKVAEENKLDLTQHHQRESLAEFLKLLRKEAPRIHMSFSANPSAEFLLKLVGWLRTNMHPHVLVAVGLQPGIGAGCVLRTENRYFDMSLGKRFTGNREMLMKLLNKPVGPVVNETVQIPAEAAEVPA